LERVRFIFTYDNLAEELDLLLDEQPADLVIIDDPLAGRRKGGKSVKDILHDFRQLAQHYQCAFLFAKNTGKKAGDKAPCMSNLSASSIFESEMRLILELRRDRIDPALRHLCLVKGSYLPPSSKDKSFLLHFHEHNLTFQNTGKRIPFENLAKPSRKEESRLRFLRARKLLNAGYNFEEIAREIGYAGKGSVSKLFEKAHWFGWDTAEASAGNTNINVSRFFAQEII
jgi:hypothetical protein